MDIFFCRPVSELTKEACSEILENTAVHHEFKVFVSRIYNYDIPSNSVVSENKKYILFPKRFTSMTDIEIAKQYFQKPLYEVQHLCSMGYLLNKKHNIEIVLQYFPRDNNFYKYRIYYCTYFLMRILECKSNDMDSIIQEYQNVLRNDYFLEALCSKYSLNIEQKIKEIIIIHLYRTRAFIILCCREATRIPEINSCITKFYKFQHSNPTEHAKISLIISIISGDVRQYIEREIRKLNDRSLGLSNICDVLDIYLQNGYTEKIWDMVQTNMDIFLKLRNTIRGCKVIGRWFFFLKKIKAKHQIKDNRYQLLLRIKKLCLNRIVDSVIPKDIIFNVKLFESGLRSECITCLEKFHVFVDLVYVCSICNCTYHITCFERMCLSERSENLRCALCRTKSNGKITNLAKEIGLM